MVSFFDIGGVICVMFGLLYLVVVWSDWGWVWRVWVVGYGLCFCGICLV